jgi:hypothetical protein
METQELIATAESGSFPANWHVWTLRRQLVMREVAWQAMISLAGFFLLIIALFVTIPDNFTQGSWKIALTISLLLLFAIMAFGGLALVFGEFNRLRQWGHYLLVMTPDDFVKRTPRDLVHVPMEHVTNIRLVGAKAHTPDDSEHAAGVQRMRPFGFSLYAVSFRRTPRQQPKLSFVDDRTDKTVIVGQDHAFDDLGALEYVLRIYVGDKERALRAARSRR